MTKRAGGAWRGEAAALAWADMRRNGNGWWSGVWAFLAAVVAVVGVLFVGRWVWSGAEVVTDPGRYGEVLAQLRGAPGGSVAHFPAELPRGVTGVEFLCRPKVLQGAFVVRLRYRAAAGEVGRVVEAFGPKRVAAPAGRVYPNFEPVGEGFEVFLLGVREVGNGNHGESYGVAVDAAAGEVVYWAEEW